MDSDLIILIILSSCKMDCPDRGDAPFFILGTVVTGSAVGVARGNEFGKSQIKLAHHDPESAGAVACGEIDRGQGTRVVGGAAFAFDAESGHVLKGDWVELGAVGGQEDGALGHGHFQRCAEEILKMLLDLPTAAVVPA